MQGYYYDISSATLIKVIRYIRLIEPFIMASSMELLYVDRPVLYYQTWQLALTLSILQQAVSNMHNC